MAKNADKQRKAVQKIRKSVRKAVDKGVSATVVSAAVDDALATDTDNEAGESGVDPQVTAKAAKLPGRSKPTDITLKRGVAAPSGKAILNKKPLKPDSEKLKKLPGKHTPPTTILHRGRNS
jgi:hypothetical protein